MEDTIEALKQHVRETRSGETGERLAQELEAFLRELLAEYSAALGVGQAELLAAFEKNRKYRATSFYRRTNFPRLENLTLLANMREFRKRYPSGCFRCPACGGISSNPVQCNSGLERGAGDARHRCDYKSYWPEHAGKGMRVLFREEFIEKPVVFEIFMPIEVEGTNPGGPPAWPT